MKHLIYWIGTAFVLVASIHGMPQMASVVLAFFGGIGIGGTIIGDIRLAQKGGAE